MSKPSYLTAPQPISTLPPGIPYIVGNEAAERFSFYGMKAILTVYLTKYLVDWAGKSAVMSPEDAKSTVHFFVALAYTFPLAGAILSDWWLGKYRTIIALSLVYCLGHLLLAVIPGREGLWLGMVLIAVGAGGIKPCVSAHVGDQFGEQNQHLLTKVFGWFYFSINAGATVAFILTPWLLVRYGHQVAFGLPGVLMALATYVFWLGRNRYVHIPPAGSAPLFESLKGEGGNAIVRLIPLYLLVAVFWALFDQTGSAWVLQAEQMDRQWLGFEWESSQIQAANSIFVLALIPAFTYGVYPVLTFLRLGHPLSKVAIGAFVMVLGFGISAWIEEQIQGGCVESVSAQASAERWAGRHLIDGNTETSWLSGNKIDSAPKAEPVEILIRLREHQAWQINRVELAAVQQWRREESGLQSPANSDLRPAKIVIAVADAPKGPWTEVANQSLEWNSEGNVEITFSPVSAHYVRLTATSAAPGIPVELAEVRVLTNSTLLSGSEPARSAVWPDVAAVGSRPLIGWQLVAYFFLTCAEVMISITCLEFSYTQAPNRVKSLIMSLYMLSVAVGNFATSFVNQWIQNADGTTWLPGASYYWFFTTVQLVAAFGFVVVAFTFKERTYLQHSEESAPASGPA